MSRDGEGSPYLKPDQGKIVIPNSTSCSPIHENGLEFYYHSRASTDEVNLARVRFIVHYLVRIAKNYLMIWARPT